MIYLIKRGNQWRGRYGMGYTSNLTEAGPYYDAGVVEEGWFKRGNQTLHPITEVVYALRERRTVLLEELDRIDILLEGAP